MIAQDVFVIAMNLMDEVSQDGTYAGYADDYKKKSWPILTTLQTELLPLSVSPLAITSDQSPLQVDDRTGTVVLPYGLAAHLLLTENPTVSSFFNERYDELKRKRPAKVSSIKDVYGIKTGEEETTVPSTSGIEGGSFLDPNSGTYDGGDF
jgi:hypothetical protein